MEYLRIAALVLAAGNSSRMREGNKLLMDVNGKIVIKHIIDEVLKAKMALVRVILGYQDRLIRETLGDESIKFVVNSEWKSGMSTSIRSGITSLPTGIHGAMIILGDMPTLNSKIFRSLVLAFNQNEGKKIVYPTFKRLQGNPVIFPRKLFSELLTLEGDKGGKSVLLHNIDLSIAVDIGYPHVLHDVDTQDDLKKAGKLIRGDKNGNP